MARFTPRLTAGVGVLVAFLLLGGSATEAVADPGRSHSDRGNSSDRGNGNGNGNGNSRGGSDRGDDYRRGNDNSRKRGEDDGDASAERGSVASPEVQFGSGPIDLADVAELTPSLAAGKSGDEDGNADPGSSRVDVADVAELAPSIAAGSSELRSSEPGAGVFGGFGVAGSSDRSGSYRADTPKARFSLPRLTLGNGRTPSIRRGESESQLQAPVLQPAPAAPPPAPPPQAPAPPPSWVVKRLPAAPVLTQQLGVSQEADWSDPLWGLTGLLLIPAAGAILGYRQARAAHAADRLRRS
ncbi:MAG: hypothetical protein ACXWEI_03165 [Mycobacterium sp.]